MLKMKKYLLIIIHILLAFSGLSQEIVYSRPYISKEKLPYYLDEMATFRNITRPSQLLRYYELCRYIYLVSPEDFNRLNLASTMDSIVNSVQKTPNSTFESNLLLYMHNEFSKEFLPNLLKASELQPGNPVVLEKLIDYYYYYSNTKALIPVLAKLRASGIIPGFIFDYSRDVLRSVETGGILFTNGYFDTYPLLILQNLENVRKDVKIVPLFSYLVATGYRVNLQELNKLDLVNFLSRKYDNVPVYFPLTMDKSILKVYTNDLYVTGLALKYSPTEEISYSLLAEAFDHFSINEFGSADKNDLSPAHEELLTHLANNYLVPLFTLEDYYDQNGNVDGYNKVSELTDWIASICHKDALVAKRRSVKHITR